MSSPIKFLSGVLRRAKQKIVDARTEIRVRKLLSSSGLSRVTDQIFTMEGRDFEAVEKILEKFHAGHYLVVVIGSRILRDCPAGVLDSAKIDFENPDSLSDVISACQSIDRWLLADSSNITVICADRPQIGKLLSCYFYYTLHQKALKKEVKAEVEWKGEPEEILKGTEPAQPKKPSLRRFSSATPPRRTVKLLHSQKRFIKDFKMAVDNGFNSAGDPLILKELVIERLPPADSNGAKISVLIQQNKRFAFSTMQRGGVIWLPATKAEPATACIPIRALVKDDALIKVYHHPDHATTNRPQKLLFKVRVYMDVARKRGYLLRFEKSEIDETATKESYSNRFRFQTLFEEPETKNPSPYAEPHSKKAQAARKYWDEMKKRKGYTYISRVDPLTLLAEREKERENERTGARATESKEDTKAPKDDKKGLESGLNEMSTSAEELKGDEERNSAPVEEPLDDFQLAQRLQNQYNQEAKEYGEAGEGEQGNFTGDEAYARQLQMQMDSEVRESRVEMLLRTGAIEPRQLNYEQLLELDENIQRGYGRNSQLISMLPEFKCKGGKHLEQKCMVCFEKFAEGESMRSLPCIHHFHRKCIDRWLCRSKKCPICNRRIDETMAVVQN